MAKTPKSQGKSAKDYAGGGSDFPQDPKNASSPQKGMIDDDMGKYGGVAPNKVPRVVDKTFDDVAGGGSPVAFTKKRDRSKVRGQRP